MADTLAIGDPRRWAQEQFGDAKLGDKRRTSRLVQSAAMMASNSSGSIPQQMGDSPAMRATYRLYSRDEVVHEAVCAPHFRRTREAASCGGVVLMVQDTSELNFTSHKACKGLGPIGHGKGIRGLHQQNVLAVDGSTGLPLGLMLQTHHTRTERPAAKKVSSRTAARRIPKEERESHWWTASIEKIGSPPAGTTWVHVGDRGEDFYGAFMACIKTGTDWVIRAARSRCIETEHGPGDLFTVARAQPAMGTRKVRLSRPRESGTEDKATGAASGGRGRGRKADTELVELHVSSTRVRLMPPQKDPAYVGAPPVDCFVVRAWEANPPPGVAPLEWILLTSMPCEDVASTMRVVEFYAKRWLIEEFHKCEKTGCAVESRRLETRERLEPLIGTLSVLAVCLLQLKMVARDNPEVPAKELFDDRMTKVMAAFLKCPAEGMTIGKFWTGIGRLGGHMGRKCDGPIGWLRAWKGWMAFRLLLQGAELFERATQPWERQAEMG